MKKSVKIAALAVIVIAAAGLVMTMNIRPFENTAGTANDAIYLEIGNLSDNASDCVSDITYTQVSEKQVFYNLFWKESQLKNITTDLLWMKTSLLGELYSRTKEVYADHLERCGCIADVIAFQNKVYNGTSRSEIPSCVFDYLPEAPYNLKDIAEPLKQSWNIQTACTLVGSEYWKQPEFYKMVGGQLSPYGETPFGLTGGYGGYSSEMVAIRTPGMNFSICLFAFSAGGSSSYQAIPFWVYVLGGKGTSPALEEHQFSDGNRTVGTEDMSRYFKIEIVPKTILLEPAYPLFYSNWTQKVVLNIQISPDAPKGRYMIILGPFGTVSEEQDRVWQIEYGNRYANQAGYYQEVLRMGVEIS